jgi:DNA-directed RNA polymerase subunit RPC12/RpoP
MSYIQIDEASFVCPKCKREYSLNAPGAQYGLWQGKTLARCANCFEQIKHRFWLRVMAEEENGR